MASRTSSQSKNKKKGIPKALREQVWLAGCGRVYESKCSIPWCSNTMTVHDFHCGHNVPESHGGVTLLHNLVPICARCNLSMGAAYTIDEWKQAGGKHASVSASVSATPTVSPRPTSCCPLW